MQLARRAQLDDARGAGDCRCRGRWPVPAEVDRPAWRRLCGLRHADLRGLHGNAHADRGAKRWLHSVGRTLDDPDLALDRRRALEPGRFSRLLRADGQLSGGSCDRVRRLDGLLPGRNRCGIHLDRRPDLDPGRPAAGSATEDRQRRGRPVHWLNGRFGRNLAHDRRGELGASPGARRSHVGGRLCAFERRLRRKWHVCLDQRL